LFERESVQRHIKKSGAAREEVAADVEGRVGTGCWWDGGNTSDTLTKCGANGAQRMPDKDNFGAVLQPLIEQVKWPADVAPTLNQCRTGSGSPEYSNQELFSQGGGGLVLVMQPITVRSSSVAGFVEDTVGGSMRATGGDCQGGSESLVLQPVPYTKAKRAQSDTDDKTWVEGQVNPTLSLFDCGDVRATTIAIQGNLIGRDKGRPQGVGASTEGAMYTMTKADVHGVAHAIPLDLRNSQRDPEKHDAQNRQGLGVGSVGDPAPTVDASFVHGVAQAMTVRRLTPRECERLQGFPDDYTLIPWRKKAAGDCPDGPRYKALGNSMAVNCMEWIGERIAAVEAGEDK
jgi:DNA (cytosine-5)-methyltransferase 1